MQRLAPGDGVGIPRVVLDDSAAQSTHDMATC
jgi:hypothetical protein